VKRGDAAPAALPFGANVATRVATHLQGSEWQVESRDKGNPRPCRQTGLLGTLLSGGADLVSRVPPQEMTNVAPSNAPDSFSTAQVEFDQIVHIIALSLS